MIFNNDTYEPIYTEDRRKRHAIYVEHDEPSLFGENNEYGLIRNGFGLKMMKLGGNGVMGKDILIRDAHAQGDTLHLKLAMMDNKHDFPVTLGVIHDVEAPTYDEMVNEQIEEVAAKKRYHNSAELLETNDTREVK